MLQPYLEKHATTGYYMNTEHADSQQKMAWGEKTEKNPKKNQEFPLKTNEIQHLMNTYTNVQQK